MRRDFRGGILAVAVVLCTGCGMDQPTQPLDVDPAWAISDATTGGTGHFFWLPPLASGSSYGGTFLGTLSPVVRICDWLARGECGETVLEFSRTYGPAGHRVGVDVHGEHYHLNWDTRAFPDLPLGTVLRVSVLLGDVELGFADVQVEADGRGFKNLRTQEILGLAEGRTLPIKFRIEAELLPLSIAFHTRRDGNLEVYLADLTGQRLVNLTAAPALDGTPSWSPDGTRIAFTSDRHEPGGTPDVYLMNVDGSGVQRLTHAGGWKPAWSPDGNRIAFQRGWPPSDTNQDIWIHDLAAGAETQLTDPGCPPGADAFEDIDPTWEPRLGWVTFSRQHNEGAPDCGSESDVPIESFDVVAWNPFNPVPIRNQTRSVNVDDLSPAWSRDGHWLVWARRTGDVESDLWIKPRFGDGFRPLTSTPGWINQEADWSYDGTALLFTRGADEAGLGLWLMPLDGGRYPLGMVELIPDASWGRFRPPGP
jgi:TolB protein